MSRFSGISTFRLTIVPIIEHRWRVVIVLVRCRVDVKEEKNAEIVPVLGEGAQKGMGSHG